MALLNIICCCCCCLLRCCSLVAIDVLVGIPTVDLFVADLSQNWNHMECHAHLHQRNYVGRRGAGGGAVLQALRNLVTGSVANCTDLSMFDGTMLTIADIKRIYTY